MNLEMIIFELITHSGDAKSLLFEAIQLAKLEKVAEAAEKIQEAEEKLSLAHKAQTTLIQTEAKGEGIPVSLLLIHAQDHLMNAMLFKDLAKEFVELYNRLPK